jgi:uncharacterized coiled-coil protein SlyX
VITGVRSGITDWINQIVGLETAVDRHTKKMEQMLERLLTIQEQMKARQERMMATMENKMDSNQE